MIARSEQEVESESDLESQNGRDQDLGDDKVGALLLERAAAEVAKNLEIRNFCIAKPAITPFGHNQQNCCGAQEGAVELRGEAARRQSGARPRHGAHVHCSMLWECAPSPLRARSGGWSG
jgi:hypothetical protein